MPCSRPPSTRTSSAWRGVLGLAAFLTTACPTHPRPPARLSIVEPPVPRAVAANVAPPAPPQKINSQAEPATFVLAAGGDVSLARGCGQKLLKDPSYDPFRGVASLWADADARFVNLEAPLSEQHGETQSPHHALVFTGPPSGADALSRAFVSVVSTANNHAWDYTKRGLLETLANLDRVGIQHAGTGPDTASAYRPVLLSAHGLTIALLAVTHVWNLGNFAEEDARHFVAWADDPRLPAAIAEAKRQADFVIVSYHGGEEYLDVPPRRTRKFLDRLMSLGVDAVIGHHPHVPQGLHWYGARPVLFSLGNLVFDGRRQRTSYIAKLQFERGRPVQVWACPYAIDGYEPKAPLAPDALSAFQERLRVVSNGTSSGAADAQGCFRLSPNPAPETPGKN